MGWGDGWLRIFRRSRDRCRDTGPFPIIAWIIVGLSATCVMLSLVWLSGKFGHVEDFLRYFRNFLERIAAALVPYLFFCIGAFLVSSELFRGFVAVGAMSSSFVILFLTFIT
jgi:amino acid permease